MKNLQSFLSLIIAVVIINVSGAKAQSIHSVYTNSFSTADLISTVMVSSQSGVNYMLGTDADNKLFVAEMDEDFPTPQPSWVKYFQIPTTTTNACGQIFLIGGVIHPLNNEIFVYGYGDNDGNYYDDDNVGVFAVIKMTSGMPASVAFRHLTTGGSPALNTPIISACWANHPTSSSITAYGFAFNGILARVFVSGGTPTTLAYKKIPNYNIKSVAYDADLNKFVVSANGSFTAIASISNTVAFSTPFNVYTLDIQQPNIFMANITHKVLLEDPDSYSTQNAILIHDVIYSEGSGANFMWGEGYFITNIDYATGTVNDYKLFIVENHKAIVMDAAYNFSNLYILGMISPVGSTKRSLLQTDMSFSNSILKTMDDVPSASYRPEYLSNIIFNNVMGDVLSSGSINGQSYLVETMDLSSSDCDTEVNLLTPDIDFDINNFSGVNPITTYSLGTASTSTVTNYLLDSETACNDFLSASNRANRKAEIQQIIDENRAKAQARKAKNQNLIQKTSDITVFGNTFVCENFVGQCNYKIIDVFGKVIDKGTTKNGIYNNIYISTSGTYFINVIDENNNISNAKILITK